MAVAAVEIKGSRHEQQDGNMKHAEGRYVGVDSTDTGVPVVGTTFFTPEGGSAESGLTGRRCVHITIEQEWLPGLRLYQIQYAAPIAHA